MKKKRNSPPLPPGRMEKLSLMTRFVLLLILLSVVGTNATVHAQLNQKVTLSMRNATLGEVLVALEKQTNIEFIYDRNEVSGTARINVEAEDENVTEVLSLCLRNTGLTYVLQNEVIIIKPAGKVEAPQQRPSVPVTVTGRVIDENGTPILGAAVYIKSTPHIGTATDASGNFSLRLPDPSKSLLVFSYIGKVASEVAYTGQAVINVTLEDDSAIVEDVVVTGMFTRSRESYTGSVTEISKEDLRQYKGQNLIKTLGNIDPSINIALDNMYGSDPNRLPDITVRGNSSLPRSLEELNDDVSAELNAPLIIMDGFPVTLQKLMDFNDENIESINILKDASATAIYGSRGANGVIVITTRRPTEGELRVGVRIGLNMEIPDLSSYNLMNAREKLRVEEAAGIYDSESISYDIRLKESYYRKLADIERGVDTYWLSKPLRTSVGQNYNVNLDFGTEKFQVGSTLSYNRILGVMKGSERNTFSGTIDLRYTYKNFRFRNQTGVDINKAKQSPYGSFSEYAQMNPYWRTHDEDGNLIKSYLRLGDNTYNPIPNPLYNAGLNSKDQNKYNTVYNNFQVEWEIVDGLRMTANLALSKTQSTSDKFVPPGHTSFQTSEYQTEDNFFRKGSYTYGTGEAFNYETNIRFDYTRRWGGKHLLVAGFNYSMSEDSTLDYIIRGEGFINENIDFFPNALQYAEGTKPEGSESLSRRVGYTANVNYSYDGRYYADLSYRIDGSSLFGSDNKFAPFWSAGIGWNIHNEKFLRDNRTIDRLKVRASIGETGSQQFNAYMAQRTFRYYPDKRYIQWSGAELMALGNPELKWQTTFQTNIGLESDLFDRRLRLMFDLYKKKTTDLLSSLDIPRANGFRSYTANVGEVENRGFEASVQGFIIRDTQRELTWNVTAKIAYNKNKIVKLSQAIKDQTEYYLQNDIDSGLLFEGHSANSIYAVPSLGIDPSTGREIFLDPEGIPIRESQWRAGYRRYYGVAEPKYRGNISSYLSYKNLSLNLSFAYHWGGMQYNSTLRDKVEIGTADLEYNVDKRVYDDRWQNPGDVKFFKAMSNDQKRASSRYVMKDNVFQLQTINLMYRWRADFLKNTGIEFLNLSFNMSDVFYLSTIKRERGTAYPFARRTGFTISLQF